MHVLWGLMQTPLSTNVSYVMATVPFVMAQITDPTAHLALLVTIILTMVAIL